MKSGRLLAVYVVLAVTCFVVAMLPVNYVARAESPGPDWVGGQLKFEKATDYNYQPDDSYELFPNIPSQNIEASRNTNNNTILQNLVTETHQVTPTSVGYFSSSHVLPFGESRWQKLDLGIFDSTFFYPNPSDSGLLAQMYYNSYYNNDKKFVRYISDWRQVFGKYSADGGGNVTRYVVNGYDLNASTTTLLNPDGSKMIASRSVQPSFSKNGKWAFLHTPAGDLRAEVPSLKYRVLAPVWNDRGMVVSSAVSNSGRFVAVGGVSTELRIYDTESCSNDTAGDCKNRTNMTQFVKGEYVKSLGAEHSPVEVFNLRGVKFVNESKLEIYFEVVFSDKTLKYEKLFVGVDPGPQTTRYLAMGDSFSSGEGALRYRSGTNFYIDDNNYNLCHQSTISYPYLLKATLSPDWFGDVACSGAVGDNVARPNDVQSNYDPAAQVHRSDSGPTPTDDYIKNHLIPGYFAQMDYVKIYYPTMATISLGGNDIGFLEVLTKCVTQKYTQGSNCYGDASARDWLASSIDRRITYWSGIFSALKNGLSGDQKLFVIGYPQIVNTAGDYYGDCNMNVHLAHEEREFANNLVDYINGAIRIAANNAGAKYVDVSTAFYDSDKDYRLCGNQDVTAVNGLITNFPVLSSDQVSVKKQADIAYYESYHPNALGHVLLARRIREMTDGFSVPMPEAAKDAKYKVGDGLRMQLVGYKESQYDDNGYLKQEIVERIMNPSDDYMLRVQPPHGSPPKPNSTAKIFIHSDPVLLKEVPLDESGIIATTIKIPDNIALGPHTIHVYYTDISGRTVDIYQYVMVVHSLDDFDGNGIPNRDEKCLLVPASNVDIDSDGIDDACDGEYIKPDSGTDTAATIIRKAETRGIISREEAKPIIANKTSDNTVNDAESSRSGTSTDGDAPVVISRDDLYKNVDSEATNKRGDDASNLYGIVAIITLMVMSALVTLWRLNINRSKQSEERS